MVSEGSSSRDQSKFTKYRTKQKPLTPCNLTLQSPHTGTDPSFFVYKYTSLPPKIIKKTSVTEVGMTSR